MAGPQRLPAGEQAANAQGPRVFEPDVVGAHRQRHVGLLRRHTQLAEQSAQRRVGPVVVHQERRVDGDDPPVTVVDIVGVRVAAESRVGLVEGDPVAPGQGVGGGEAGDATADHRDGAGCLLIHTSYSEPPPSRTGLPRLNRM